MHRTLAPRIYEGGLFAGAGGVKRSVVSNSPRKLPDIGNLITPS